MSFELLEHTADLKIRVIGKDLPELFINAGLAIAAQQNPQVKDQPLKKPIWESVEIKSADQKSLLIDWLNEILSRSDLNDKVYVSFRIKELSETRLRARIAGRKVSQKQIDIKAATYHDLEIRQVNSHWQAIIVFDI